MLSRLNTSPISESSTPLTILMVFVIRTSCVTKVSPLPNVSGDRVHDLVAETLELDADFGPAHILRGRVYVANGMTDRGVEELERAQVQLGPRPDVITPHAYALARAGRRREALAKLDELRRIAKPRDPAPFRIAMVHIGLGDTDRAFEWLEKAFDARDWQLAMLNVEPAFDGLRSDSRFAALVERVGLPR